MSRRPTMEVGPLVVEAYREWLAARDAWLALRINAPDYAEVDRRYRLAELALATHCALGIGVALAAAEDAAAEFIKPANDTPLVQAIDDAFAPLRGMR